MGPVCRYRLFRLNGSGCRDYQREIPHPTEEKAEGEREMGEGQTPASKVLQGNTNRSRFVFPPGVRDKLTNIVMSGFDGLTITFETITNRAQRRRNPLKYERSWREGGRIIRRLSIT